MRSALSLHLVLTFSLSLVPALESKAQSGNTPPVLVPIGDRYVRPNELLSFVVRGTDGDGHGLALSASSLPSGATFSDRGTGAGDFRWTPGPAMAGSFPVTFTLLDDGVPPASDSETITITVGDNPPPELLPIGAQRGDPGISFSIAVFATDPDNQGLTLSVSGLPDGAEFEDGGDGSGSLSWLPGPDQIGVYTLIFMVTDDGTPPASDSEQVTVMIGDVNQPPVLASIGDHTATVGVPMAIALSATDPDGDRVAFDVSGSPAEATLVDNGNGTAEWSWTPTEGSVAVGLVLHFSASDDGVPPASDSEEVVVTVGSANRPPMLGVIGSRTLRVGESLRIAITASDLDGDALRFDATGLPTGAAFSDLNGGTAELTWTPLADQVGSHPMRVTVTDDGMPAMSAFEEFALWVEAVPDVPPTALRIERARWKSGHFQRLRVRGDGAEGGASVSIVDAQSGALLAVTRADAEGHFRVNVAPFLAPCSVRAQTLSATTEPFAVEGAPGDCGVRLYTRIKRAEWLCRPGVLALEVTRLPGNASVDVVDAASGALLGSAQADHRGKLSARLALDARPARIRLELRLESAEWTLGAYHVGRARDACARNRWRHAADLEECR